MTARSFLIQAFSTVALLAGCGPVPPGVPTPTSPPKAAFSALELALIRAEFGRLPEAAPVDASNRYAGDPLAAQLGQKFFFEARYSQNGRVSCATCHNPQTGFADQRGNTSLGITFTDRRTQPLLNVGYGSGKSGSTTWLFWDGRKDSLWSQALSPPESSSEMGGTRTKVALLIFDRYQDDYVKVFTRIPALRDANGVAVAPESAMPSASDSNANAQWQALSDATRQDITSVYVNFGKAMAAYEQRLVSRSSRFDQFYDDIIGGADDSDGLTPGEKAGLRVFVGRGGCASCHFGPNLTDEKFHNLGVPQLGAHIPAADPGRQAAVSLAQADPFSCAGAWSDRPDKASCEAASLRAKASDLGAFKTPSLRGVTAGGPYFHTGFAQTVANVIDFYDMGGGSQSVAGAKDANIVPLGLTSDEKARLVDFLAALRGIPLPSELTTPPVLPP
jgi:cytochrome c peroxidase